MSALSPGLRQTGRALWLSGALGVLLLAQWGCEFKRPLTAVLGYEVYDQNCSDGLDNDHDSLVDCEDPDCFLTSTLCGQDIPQGNFREPEGDLNNDKLLQILTCHDFIDNDLDGQFDCGDVNCRNIQENCCLREFTDETCSDGIDNDQNGFVDCEDFSCSQGLFVSVCDDAGTPAEAVCDDGLDNDGDGVIDCLDSDCAGKDACKTDEDTLAACTDGVDNDGNGFVDCNDFSCSQNAAQEVVFHCENLPKEETLEACSNGIDDDQNNYTDCKDFSCSKSLDPEVSKYCEDQAASSGAEITLETCSDGKDNDDNGYTDCLDFSCSRSEDAEILEYCAQFAEDTLEKCSDGKDNNDNGYIDCADFSCSASDDIEVLQYCDEFIENSFEQCKDRIDNDGNTYVDCNDNHCVGAAEEKIIEGSAAAKAGWPVGSSRHPCQESIGIDADEMNKNCSDGFDNDGDGFVDCQDWDCSYNPRVTVCGETGLCD